MKQSTKTTVMLEAEKGFLTQANEVDIDKRIFAKVIYLGLTDKPENYKEISEGEFIVYQDALREFNEKAVESIVAEVEENSAEAE